MDRVFGFEILPAPFVVAHLQLGLLLQSLGAPLSEARHERARVFLTNALTGWEPVKHPKQLVFHEMEEERDAADRVKRDTPILVILGNPPYNSFAGVANMDEERELSEAYRTTKSAPAPQGQGLNDLYIRFFRMADRRIVEKTGKGIVSFISNYSWLDGLSFTGMRERYMEVFDHIWIDCLNGDKYKTGKLTPEGKPDPSVFSTEFNREGIQVGTAITLLARTSPSEGARTVQFRHLWGREKRDQLLAEAIGEKTPKYETVRPQMLIGLPFAPSRIDASYLSWPLLTELFPTSFPGVQTCRDDVVVDIDRDQLIARMEAYFDPEVSSQEMAQIAPRSMEDGVGFPARETRRYLIKRGFKREYVVPFSYRPFDIRWLYWEPETKLLDRNRAEYFPHVFDGNLWLSAVQQNRKEFDPPLVSVRLCCRHMVERGANMFPLLLQSDHSLLHGEDGVPRHPNLTDEATAYLGRVNAVPADLFHHVIAVLYAPSFGTENASGLRNDWPRIPLPATNDALMASATLGRDLAALLDPECPTPRKAALLRSIAPVTATEGRIDPDSGDLDITAGWGHAGKGGVTMPAKGRLLVREMTAPERDALPEGATDILGTTTCDVFLNDRVYWKNIPTRVWEYTLGGYQVIKKWLSYREKELLGRSLAADEARYVTNVARRIAAVLLLGPALDENYSAVKQAPYVWTTTSDPAQHVSR
jgi:predicted helicase